VHIRIGSRHAQLLSVPATNDDITPYSGVSESRHLAQADVGETFKPRHHWRQYYAKRIAGITIMKELCPTAHFGHHPFLSTARWHTLHVSCTGLLSDTADHAGSGTLSISGISTSLHSSIVITSSGGLMRKLPPPIQIFSPFIRPSEV